MRMIFLLPVLCVFSFLGRAQDIKKPAFKIGIGGTLAIPAYNLDYSSVGGGVDLLALYSLSQKISLSADAGFTGLPGKSILPATAIIPIRLGVRYFPGSKFYLGAKAGLGIFTIVKESTSYLAYAVGAGYNLNRHFDIGLSYDGYSKKDISFGYVGIRLGYTF
jgi:hypothetical protein